MLGEADGPEREWTPFSYVSFPAFKFEGTRVATAFPLKAYEAMRDDRDRTASFEEAIKWRMEKDRPGTLTVVEIGTGALALLAIMAARHGARKVFAIEANPEAAESARSCIRAANLENQIQVVEGLSTAVELPEKANVLVAEIIGSIGSEEGVVTTKRDARRFLHEPDRADSWIPLSCETYCAPVFYQDHRALTVEELRRPVRLCAIDPRLKLLSTPQLVERFQFNRLDDLVDSWSKELEFVVEGPEVFSGFTYFVRLTFVATPPMEFEYSTTWQNVVCILSEKPVQCDALELTFRLSTCAELSPLPARYVLDAEISGVGG